MADLATSVTSVFDFAWERLHDRVAGLTDDEYFWEPVSGCWSLRRGDDGVWRLDGEGGGGPAPDPVPVTTIAWRVGHLGGLALVGFTQRRFGDPAQVEGASPQLPTTGHDAVAFLELAYLGWREGMASLDAADWERPLGPDWGPYADDTTLDLVLHVLDELIHHGAEIGVLRDLYPHREEGLARG